jgi:hypothetical protein
VQWPTAGSPAEKSIMAKCNGPEAAGYPTEAVPGNRFSVLPVIFLCHLLKKMPVLRGRCADWYSKEMKA